MPCRGLVGEGGDIRLNARVEHVLMLPVVGKRCGDGFRREGVGAGDGVGVVVGTLPVPCENPDRHTVLSQSRPLRAGPGRVSLDPALDELLLRLVHDHGCLPIRCG